MRRATVGTMEARLPRDSEALAQAVREGLGRARKSLPPWIFYDSRGSQLYELITRLPAYYPSRVERCILQEHCDEMVKIASEGAPALHAIELGAGDARKSQLVLGAIVRRYGGTLYRPCDISPQPLAAARERIQQEQPEVVVRPVVGPHEAAIAALARMGEAKEARPLAMFLGSSIGNYEGQDAVDLLSAVAHALAPCGALLLGTDLRKAEDVLRAAYDDAAGVTAAFNLNALARINRELGGGFDLARFRHVALWNEAASRIEMHLESTIDQVVPIDALRATVAFGRGERIRTESSVKYVDESVDDLLGAAGLRRVRSFRDPDSMFAVHLARTVVAGVG